jgi:hypothetical protein
MTTKSSTHPTGCCTCSLGQSGNFSGITRRAFLGGASVTALGSRTISGLTWPLSAAATNSSLSAPERAPLVVKPILTYETPRPRTGTSWRNWGGIETEEQATSEKGRINEEKAGQTSRSSSFPYPW